MKFNYANIAISGGVAVGNSTLMNCLRPFLEPEGYTLTSIGQLHRKRMKKAGHENHHTPLAHQLSDQEQIETEKHVYTLLKNKEKYVIDAWLAGFISRDIAHTLRVLLVINDPRVKIERFCQREQVTPDVAAQSIKEREEGNFAYWKKLYGNYNFWDPSYFHLVLDSGSLGVEEIRDRVLKEFGYNMVQ